MSGRPPPRLPSRGEPGYQSLAEREQNRVRERQFQNFHLQMMRERMIEEGNRNAERIRREREEREQRERDARELRLLERRVQDINMLDPLFRAEMKARKERHKGA